MPVVYPEAIKNARLQIVADATDAAVGNGKLKLYTAGMAALLSTIVLSRPAWNVASGSMTIADAPLSDLSAVASGTPALAIVTDGDDNVVISGLTVGIAGSGANAIVSKPTIEVGNEVRLTGGTINHA